MGLIIHVAVKLIMYEIVYDLRKKYIIAANLIYVPNTSFSICHANLARELKVTMIIQY